MLSLLPLLLWRRRRRWSLLLQLASLLRSSWLLWQRLASLRHRDGACSSNWHCRSTPCCSRQLLRAQGLPRRRLLRHGQPLRSSLGLLCNSRMVLGSHVGCWAQLRLGRTCNRYAQGGRRPLLLHHLCNPLLRAAQLGRLQLSLLLCRVQLGRSSQLRSLLLQELIDDAAQRCRPRSFVLNVAQPCRVQRERSVTCWVGSLRKSDCGPASVLPSTGPAQPTLTRLDLLFRSFRKRVIVCCERELQGESAEE